MQHKNDIFSLNRKLLILVLLTSSAFTILTTLFNFWIDFRSEKEAQLQTLIQIEKSSVASVTKAVWDLDDHQINRNIDGLLRLKDVVTVVVTDNEGNDLAARSKQNLKKRISELSFAKEFPLNIKNNGISTHVGDIKVTVTNYFLYKRLLEKMLIYFVSQGLKTMVVSFILLALFNLIVTKHIVKITSYCKNILNTEEFSPADLEVERKYFKDQRDEIDVLFESFSELINEIHISQNEKNRELKEKEKALDHLSRLASLGEMAANVGHEINNPLAIIMVSASRIRRVGEQFLQGREQEQEKILKSVERLENNARRLQKISGSLVHLARSDSGEREIYPIHETINEVCSLVGEKMKSRQVDFRIEIENPDQVIFANNIQLGQVLVNLINNALHALETSDKKVIKVRTYSDESNTYFEVSDSGCGIPAEFRDNIFVPFFTTKDVGKGTGLGLSISHKIIKCHGGELYLHPESTFTTFVIRLPMIDEKEESGAA